MVKRLSKQQALDSDPKSIQRINLAANLESHSTILLLEMLNKQFYIFSQETVKVF